MSGKMVTRCFASALALFIAASVLCGIVYPWAVTGLSAIAFPYQATGSIIEVDGVKYGSELVGQPFKSDTHLWGRPTVVDASSFSDAEGQPLLWYSPENLSPASDEFAARVDERIQQVRAAHPDRAAQPVPSDLVTVSGSGFDPHISPVAADYQVERIAAATGRPERGACHYCSVYRVPPVGHYRRSAGECAEGEPHARRRAGVSGAWRAWRKPEGNG